MDLYGIQIKLDDGTDMVAQLAPMFILDYIEGDISGTRTYDVPSGLSLNVIINNMESGWDITDATINGNTVNFVCRKDSSIVIYVE